MSTAKQIAELAAPFLERHPDFALVGRSLVLKPVGHLMRRFFLDRTSIKGYVQPMWSVAAMFGPPPTFTVSVGEQLVQGFGYVNNPDTIARLFSAMETIASEILRPTNDFDQLLALAAKDIIVSRHPPSFAMSLIANGEFHAAMPYLTTVLTRENEAVERAKLAMQRHRSQDSRPARMDAYSLERLLEGQTGLGLLHELLRDGDHQAIAALLHRWEAAAVEMAKVEYLWVPSPFPFEAPVIFPGPPR